VRRGPIFFETEFREAQALFFQGQEGISSSTHFENVDWDNWSASQPPERFGGAEFALDVAFERLQGEAAQVVAAAAGPWFGGEG
jgi:hypothetical protein